MKLKHTIVLLILTVGFGCQRSSEVITKPNIIILLADDAGYLDFGFMESKDLRTPNIDQLAVSGAIFTDAHTSASVCSPSRAGLLTGRYQQRFGHEHNSPPLGFGIDTAEVTMASVLQADGYKTGIFGKWHVGDEEYNHPNQRGFDEFYGFIAGHRSYFPDEPGAERNAKSLQLNGEYVDFDGYLTDVLGEAAIDFIDKNKENPFFVYLSYSAVHTPMQATEEDLAKFEGHPRQTLAAMTWALDRSVGKVLQKLEDEGLRDNTLIFFMSDNGGPPNNNSNNGPLKGIKGLEFEGGHRVPFIVSWPGKIEGGQSFDGLSSTLDLLPTMMASAGIVNNKLALDGVDLVPYLTGEKSGNPHDKMFWRIHPWRAARVGDLKLIHAEDVGDALYNLDADIGERDNLIRSDSASYVQVMNELRGWEEEIRMPRWFGEGPWKDVKAVMYEDYMNNQEPRATNPWQLRKLLESKSSQ